MNQDFGDKIALKAIVLKHTIDRPAMQTALIEAARQGLVEEKNNIKPKNIDNYIQAFCCLLLLEYEGDDLTKEIQFRFARKKPLTWNRQLVSYFIDLFNFLKDDAHRYINIQKISMRFITPVSYTHLTLPTIA